MTTAVKTKQDIINEIAGHISKSGPYSAWYVGIAKDAKSRLFDDHNVPRENSWWIYRETSSDTVAREIENYFLAKGCKGGDGGGDNATVYVYAYKITSTTKQ